MDDKYVKVKFSGRCEVPISGVISVPKKMWESKDPGDSWPEDLDEYISAWLTGDNFDLGGACDDIQIDDASLAEESVNG